MESGLAVILARLAAVHGDTADAFDYLALAIRHYYDAGSFSYMAGPLAVLVALLDRLGRYESATTISASATTPLVRAALPEFDIATTHLRDVLGDQTYESFASRGRNMTNATMVAYAFDEIGRARADVQ